MPTITIAMDQANEKKQLVDSLTRKASPKNDFAIKGCNEKKKLYLTSRFTGLAEACR